MLQRYENEYLNKERCRRVMAVSVPSPQDDDGDVDDYEADDKNDDVGCGDVVDD